MTNDNQASENEGTKSVAIKKNIAHRYIKSNAQTPVSHLQEQTNTDENPNLVRVEGGYNLIEILENDYTLQFYTNRKAFIPKAEKKIAELISYSTESSVSDLITQMSTPASQLIKEMEENQKPILCINEATANLACMLIYARTQSALLSKHWKEIQNGKELLMLADEHFEALASGLKLGRRTRSIINRKKANAIV